MFRSSNLLLSEKDFDWESEMGLKQESIPASEAKKDPYLPYPLRLEQKKGYLYAKVPEPVVSSTVDGLDVKVERLPMRYEALEDILDELPDGLRETISDAWRH